jgi:hypothetical protein
VTLNRFGKGLAMYVGFDLFGMVRRTRGRPFVWAWQFLKAALERVLLPRPCLRVVTDQPHSLDVSFFKVRRRKQILVHLLNGTVKTLRGDALPIPGASLLVHGGPVRPATARVLYPRPRKLRVRRDGRARAIDLPAVKLHTIVSLEA